MRAIVTRNWVPPAGIAATAALQCVIQVKIGYDGRIATRELLASSDNPTFSSTDCMANQLNQQVLSGQLR